MAGTRSAQEINLVRKINAFMKKVGASPGQQGVTIRFKNSAPSLIAPVAASGEFKNITIFQENVQGDRSAADIIAVDGSGNKFGISCKRHNPASFCGSGLKSFTQENVVMNMWMKQVLGKVAAYYLSIMNEAKEELANITLKHIQTHGTSKFTKAFKDKLTKEIQAANGFSMPNVYIPIPKGMRYKLFRGDGHRGGEPVTHYITGGTAASVDEDIPTRTITINDCEMFALNEIAESAGNNLYIVVRKRRADQFVKIADQTGAAIKDSNGFLSIYSRSSSGDAGRRIQVREQTQLPNKLKNMILQDNSQAEPTTRVPPKTGKDSDAVIIDVPIDSVLNAVAAARFNK